MIEYVENFDRARDRRTEEIDFGVPVIVRDAFDRFIAKRALSGCVDGRDFLVVWVLNRDEPIPRSLDVAKERGACVPWPAEDVWLDDPVRTRGGAS